jgi:hypothetical protein
VVQTLRDQNSVVFNGIDKAVLFIDSPGPEA